MARKKKVSLKDAVKALSPKVVPKKKKKKQQLSEMGSTDDANMSTAKQDFIEREITHLMENKGYPRKRAIGAAYGIAKRKGYK